MILLGIDPGTVVSGFCILKIEHGRLIMLDCGALKMSSSQSLVERVGKFHSFFEEKIRRWSVSALALETSFLGKNAQNFLKLGYLRGALYVLASHNSLLLHEFSPREVKQAVTGYGGAEKDQVARVVVHFFPGLVMPGKLDITDAIAVALCGAWKSK